MLMKEVRLGNGWSLVLAAMLVNAACYGRRIPPQISTATGGELPFEVAWETREGNGFSGTTVVAGGTVYAGSLNRKVYAIDLSTGEELWNKRQAGAIIGGVAAAGDTLFVGTDRPSGRVVAIRSRDGKRIWQNKVGRVGVPLAVARGTVVAHMANGQVVALRSADGAEIWRRYLGPTLSGPMVSEPGSVIATTMDSVFRLDLLDGSVLARRATSGSVVGGWSRDGSSGLVGGTTAAQVIRLDRRDLTTSWSVTTDREVLTAPAVSGDTVFAVTRVGSVYRIDPGASRLATRIALLESPMTGPPVRYRDWLLVGGADGVIRALSLDGVERWRVALWQPIQQPPVVLGRDLVAFGGIGDIQRLEAR